MKLISIPVFLDNYIWILVNENYNCLIIDPGKATPVIKIIKDNKWKPEAILLTHHHTDHVSGVMTLRSLFNNIKVYGPEETQGKGVTQVVHEGEIISLLNKKFHVLSTPGHTLGHICFFSFPYLFCGDTLFSGGCGKLFEGTYNQMYQSLQKINLLPEETIICCAHEYTLTNIKFAASILPNDLAIKDYYHKICELRSKNQKTLPSSLKNERKVNIFLRTNDLSLVKEISKNMKEINLTSPEEIFAFLRIKKDNF